MLPDTARQVVPFLCASFNEMKLLSEMEASERTLERPDDSQIDDKNCDKLNGFLRHKTMEQFPWEWKSLHYS